MIYWRATVVATACLLYAIADIQVAGQHLDVCATCHSNATCEDKPNGGGKICNCMYGFVGNGRTSCIDKDECQIGANTICGLHTSCHNTYGSFYCTCQVGYSPSNNLAIFIPNDGTHCQDIDECRVQGICGEGGLCRNLQGGYNCHCQLGYQVRNGTEPFHPDRDPAFCKAIDCGKPPSVENAVQLSTTVTRYGSVIKFGCEEGFTWRNGDNSSVCGANGDWKGPSLVCEEVDCGAPPALPHSVMLWDQSSRMGSEVVYQCSSGYYNVGQGNVSVCTANGKWNTTSLLCQEISCGEPPLLPHTGQMWNGSSTVGSTVLYYCKKGFYIESGGNLSHCTEKGYWTRSTVSCKEITCGDPPLLPHTGQVWNGSATLGSVVFYYCKDGFHREEGGNVSFCAENGYWTNSALSCQEIDCGAPPALPHSVMLWDQSSRMGSGVVYQCSSGYFNVGQGNVSVCTANGQWSTAALLCQEIDCGAPPALPHSVMLWDQSSRMGSGLVYQCSSGYFNVGQGNVSVCTANGQWSTAALLCQEIDCGAPPALPHSVMLWDQSSRMGSEVVYQCSSGYYDVGQGNVSVCTAHGQWSTAALLCQEISCGEPPLLPHTGQMWNGSSTVGSTVLYYCKKGFYIESGGNLSHCTENGYWTGSTLSCKEINCGEPLLRPHSKMLWNQTSNMGSVVYYQCVEGYSPTSGRDYTTCEENGLWEDIDLQCEEINCGPPLILPYTNMLWDNTTGLGSVVEYVCMEGFYQESGNILSTCTASGKWGNVSVKCKAKCGPVPTPVNTEVVVWENGSVVIHGCLKGYHSWKGSNISECDNTGKWKVATLRCREIKPAIGQLVVFDETCLSWKAEKYEEDTEEYRIVSIGLRNYQRTFRDKRKKLLSSIADQLEVCLNLLPVTNYTITVTAVSAKFTSTVTTSTSLEVPQAPEISFSEVETSLPTLWLRRSTNTLDPISFYQVFVLPLDGILVFECTSPKNPDFSNKMKFHGQYITAQIHLKNVGREMNFTVGDGHYYGGYYNAPLQHGRDYYIILRAVSHWRGAFKHSCVIWAKVRGMSYVMKITLLFVGGSVGFFAMAIFLGYCYVRFCKKTIECEE